MDAKRRRLRRQQLDRQLETLSDAAFRHPPKGGWIRAIREALGITFETLGRKLGVSRQSAQQLEVAEVSGSITVKRLRAVSDALNCELMVVLVPRQPLEETIRARATKVARDQILRTGHSMAIESQALTDQQIERMIHDATEEMIERGDPRIWE